MGESIQEQYSDHSWSDHMDEPTISGQLLAGESDEGSKPLPQALGELSAADAYPHVRDANDWTSPESVQSYIAEHGEPHVRGDK